MDDWIVRTNELDGDIYIIINHDKMKQYSVSKLYYVDTDELIIELSKKDERNSDGRIARREIQETG